MDEASTRRLLSVKLTTQGKGKGALVELLYPTIYKQSCMLDLRFFPFDLQVFCYHILTTVTLYRGVNSPSALGPTTAL